MAKGIPKRPRDMHNNAKQVLLPAYLDNPEETRLACQCKVKGDVTVETGPEVNLFGENFFS